MSNPETIVAALAAAIAFGAICVCWLLATRLSRLGEAKTVGHVPPRPMPAPWPAPPPEISYLGDMRKLTVQAGDVFVLQLDGRCANKEVRDLLSSSLSAKLRGAPVIVLEGGMKLGAVQLSAAPAAKEMG